MQLDRITEDKNLNDSTGFIKPMLAVRKGRSMGSHQSSAMLSDTWLTPPSLIEKLGAFDLDPCTPEIMPWQTAENRYTANEDGLKQQWFGRVWLNPPIQP